MSKSWAVNESNDLYAEPGGRLAINDGLQAVMQHCEHAVKTHTGELIYNRSKGIDYENTVFSGSHNTLALEGMIRETITAIDDVTGITDFDASIIRNALHYTISIQTIYGTGIITDTESPGAYNANL